MKALASLEGLRIAFVSRAHPYTGHSGSSTYASAVLNGLLDTGATLKLVITDTPTEAGVHRHWRDPSPSSDRLSVAIRHRSTIGRHHFRPFQPRIPGKHLLRRILRSTSYAAQPVQAGPLYPPWDRELDSAETAFIEKSVRDFNPHAYILNYSWLAPLARFSTRTLPPGGLFLLTHDVRHLECRLDQGKLVFKERACYPLAREKTELSSIDTIIAIQAREAAFLHDLCPEKNVITAGLPVAPAWKHTDQPIAGRCLLVGSNNDSNASGAQWLLQQVWPAVHRERPEARLHVCGDVCSHPFLATVPEGVVLHGRVDDLQSEYARASLVVAPLFSGSGLKIKVVEAISHGLPIVGTSVAFDGIDPLPSELQPCNDAETFAKRVLNLLQDDKLRLAATNVTRNIALTAFSREACLGPLISELGKLKP